MSDTDGAFPNEEEELEDGNAEDCILAVVMGRHTVGIAIYDGLSSSIYSTQLGTASPMDLSDRLEVRTVSLKAAVPYAQNGIH